MHETTKMGFSEQKHWVGPLFLKLPLDDIKLDSMGAIVSKELSGEEMSWWRGVELGFLNLRVSLWRSN